MTVRQGATHRRKDAHGATQPHQLPQLNHAHAQPGGDHRQEGVEDLRTNVDEQLCRHAGADETTKGQGGVWFCWLHVGVNLIGEDKSWVVNSSKCIFQLPDNLARPHIHGRRYSMSSPE